MSLSGASRDLNEATDFDPSRSAIGTTGTPFEQKCHCASRGFDRLEVKNIAEEIDLVFYVGWLYMFRACLPRHLGIAEKFLLNVADYLTADLRLALNGRPMSV